MIHVSKPLFQRVRVALKEARDQGHDRVTMNLEVGEFINLAFAAMSGMQGPEFRGPCAIQCLSTISCMVATASTIDPALGDLLADCWGKVVEGREDTSEEESQS